MSVGNLFPQWAHSKTPSGTFGVCSICSIHFGRLVPGILSISYFVFALLLSLKTEVMPKFSKIIDMPFSKSFTSSWAFRGSRSSSTTTISCILTKAGTSQRFWISKAICASCFSEIWSVRRMISDKNLPNSITQLSAGYFTIFILVVGPRTTLLNYKFRPLFFHFLFAEVAQPGRAPERISW